MDGTPFLLVLLSEAEACLAFHSVLLLDLRRVLASFEFEQLVGGLGQQFGHIAVQPPEECIVLRLAGADTLARRPQQRRALELPTRQAHIGFFFANKAIAFCGLQQRPHDLTVSAVLDFLVVRVAHPRYCPCAALDQDVSDWNQ